jgi:hypothetical protein
MFGFKLLIMKPYQLTIILALFLCQAQSGTAQQIEVAPGLVYTDETGNARSSLNIFVISKRKKGKVDPATRFNTLRTKLRSLFHRKNFVSITASDADQMSSKVKRQLRKHNATIGTIWFDSHGAYKKGYSLFNIGHTEISPATLENTSISSAFASLSPFTTPRTKLVIGSCYGGATYQRASIDYKDTTRMNGDSLMIRIGKLIGNGEIFGSEAWVMSKPRLFKGRPAAGGAPARKLFLDLCYAPVWERVGQWNRYNAQTESFQKINTVTLDKNGNLLIRGRAYCDEKKFTDDIQKKLAKLQPNLYK